LRRIVIILLLVYLPTAVAAQSIDQEWKNLDKKYSELVETGRFEESLEVAYQLNKIDPANTQALLYIVFSCVEGKKPLPAWVLGEPWPEANPIDRVRRKIAEFLAKQDAIGIGTPITERPSHTTSAYGSRTGRFG
jgi:hypothetical protein